MGNSDIKETIKGIKQQFMAYRNGIVADTLRRAGMDCYSVIFGLNLPQLSAIAASVTASAGLASALWADRKVRESRLLAAYLFPPRSVDRELARSLMEDVQTREEADILCFRLLRHLDFAPELQALPPLSSPHDAYLRQALRRFLS
ncbi:MAG: DNA alkylation repair protein [Muribaculaceae bacterium]|nr:DNA alkylation repair protein [Muribaculaceae bacterium]